MPACAPWLHYIIPTLLLRLVLLDGRCLAIFAMVESSLSLGPVRALLPVSLALLQLLDTSTFGVQQPLGSLLPLSSAVLKMSTNGFTLMMALRFSSFTVLVV